MKPGSVKWFRFASVLRKDVLDAQQRYCCDGQLVNNLIMLCPFFPICGCFMSLAWNNYLLSHTAKVACSQKLGNPWFLSAPQYHLNQLSVNKINIIYSAFVWKTVCTWILSLTWNFKRRRLDLFYTEYVLKEYRGLYLRNFENILIVYPRDAEILLRMLVCVENLSVQHNYQFLTISYKKMLSFSC